MEDGGEQPFQLPSFKMCRRASPQEQRLHTLRLAQRRQFGGQRLDVQIDLVVLSCRNGEITVATMMRAKRHVDIGCTRPEPRRERVRGP